MSRSFPSFDADGTVAFPAKVVFFTEKNIVDFVLSSKGQVNVFPFARDATRSAKRHFTRSLAEHGRTAGSSAGRAGRGQEGGTLRAL